MELVVDNTPKRKTGAKKKKLLGVTKPRIMSPKLKGKTYGPQFGEFCAEAAPTHTVVPVRMNPLHYGGVQTRDRWYLLLFRHDVVEARGAFQLPERSVNQLTTKDILEPVYEVD